MKKYLFVTAFLFSLLAQAQDNTVEIDRYKFLDILNDNPKVEQVLLLENGKPFTKSYLDSINKSVDAHKYRQKFLLDSINKKVTIVLRKITDEELEKVNDDFKQFQIDAKDNRKKLLGSHISDISFNDIYGVNYTDNDFKGNLVLLNFWFAKCAPCIQEMPDLNALKEKYKDYNILFYAITYDNLDVVNRFLTKFKLDLTVVAGQQKTVDQLGVSFFPTNILMDAEGKVLYVSEYFNPKGNGVNDIEKLIKKRVRKI